MLYKRGQPKSILLFQAAIQLRTHTATAESHKVLGLNVLLVRSNLGGGIDFEVSVTAGTRSTCTRYHAHPCPGLHQNTAEAARIEWNSPLATWQQACIPLISRLCGSWSLLTATFLLASSPRGQ